MDSVSGLGLPILALQAWDGFGWAGQAVFTWRVVHQWLASEKAKKSVLPPSFWAWSLVGTVLLIVYAAHRRDPVFLLGPLVNACLYGRNLWMSRRPQSVGAAATPRPVSRSVLWPVLAGIALFAAVTIEAIGPHHGLVQFERGVPWLVVGFFGQTLWSGRFVVQWYESERKGVSHLPASFFRMSIAGALLLFTYAVSQKDWVNMAAYALNPIPYVRNLVLLRRHAAEGADDAA